MYPERGSFKKNVFRCIKGMVTSFRKKKRKGLIQSLCVLSVESAAGVVSKVQFFVITFLLISAWDKGSLYNRAVLSTVTCNLSTSYFV